MAKKTGNGQHKPEVDREMDRRLAPHYRSVYANSALVGFTPFDVRIVLGEVLEVTDDKLVIEEQVKINMSPQHAKSLLGLLDAKVKEYEAKYGSLNVD